MSNHIDPASVAWGMSLGLMLGSWIRGALNAPGRRMVRPRGSYGSPRGSNPPPRFTEGRTIRGNGNGGPSTPKPPIKPQPHGGYQPRPQRGTPNTPPSEP
jgi:hypothetical protein